MRVLLSVEVRRILARRMVQALVLIALAGISVTGIVTAAKSHADDPTLIARAQAYAARDLKRCDNGKTIPPDQVPSGQTLEEYCAQIIRPESYYVSSRFHLVDLSNWLKGVSVFLVIGGWMIGASFVGAEWHAGTMATLLTWEPRRLRVLAAKVLACAAAMFVIVLALQVVLALVLAAAAALRGITAGADASWLRSVIAVALRVGAVSAAASLMGLAVAMIGRNAAAAMGGGFAYLAIFEGLIRGLKPTWQRFLMGDNAVIFINGRDSGFPPVGRSLMGSAAVLGVYVAALLVAGAVSFRARDVD